MINLENKVALVTGASRGIGQSIALTLAQAGAQVLGTATSENGAQRITQDLAGFGGAGFVLDVSDTQSIEALFSQLKEQSLVPHILVNNAGITNDKLLMRMKDED